jgi:hypothetical protein
MGRGDAHPPQGIRPLREHGERQLDHDSAGAVAHQVPDGRDDPRIDHLVDARGDVADGRQVVDGQAGQQLTEDVRHHGRITQVRTSAAAGSLEGTAFRDQPMVSVVRREREGHRDRLHPPFKGDQVMLGPAPGGIKQVVCPHQEDGARGPAGIDDCIRVLPAGGQRLFAEDGALAGLHGGQDLPGMLAGRTADRHNVHTGVRQHALFG